MSHENHDMMDHSHHNHMAKDAVNASSGMDMVTSANPMAEHNHNSGEPHHMMMMMYFHTGISDTILFKFWKPQDIGGLIGSCVFIFCLAFAYEALKFYREYLYRRSFRAVQYNTVTVPVENGGAIKETHKTVQVIEEEEGGGPSFQPDARAPIFLSRTTCNFNINKPTQSGESVGEFQSDYGPQGQGQGPSVLALQATHCSSVSCPACGTRTDNLKIPNIHRAYKVKMMSLLHFWQTMLHVVQTILSYFLMLIFMTYNIWLCIAVTLGAGVGYFFFGWKKSLVVDITEHCH